ncbi:hypothetical protein [uncultured Dokdonia sp.]|uniref:hypothetical protein n=1 Tax=uncultured Dokdonia sp. TaxID=575653 RepID=UPI00261EE3D4|nr:hypothetical protein [uncultured Dokdonia sp.]
MKSIIDIASEYVDSQGEIIKGYKYGYKGPVEFIKVYYFDFVILTINGKIPDNQSFGGACGFTIHKKDKTIQTLSFGELATLQIKNKEISDIYDKLKGVKEKSKSLSWLKNKYQLTSSELLKIKKALFTTEMHKDQIMIQLEELVSKKNRSH